MPRPQWKQDPEKSSWRRRWELNYADREQVQAKAKADRKKALADYAKRVQAKRMRKLLGRWHYEADAVRMLSPVPEDAAFDLRSI